MINLLLNRKILMVAASAALSLLISGCNCNVQHQGDCEWYLVPEDENSDLTTGDNLGICIRNYETNKQRCMYQAPKSLVDDLYGKPVILSDLETDTEEWPRTITKAVPCQPK